MTYQLTVELVPGVRQTWSCSGFIGTHLRCHVADVCVCNLQLVYEEAINNVGHF